MAVGLASPSVAVPPRVAALPRPDPTTVDGLPDAMCVLPYDGRFFSLRFVQSYTSYWKGGWTLPVDQNLKGHPIPSTRNGFNSLVSSSKLRGPVESYHRSNALRTERM